MLNPFTTGPPALVADIGGTNARFAVLDLASDTWFGQWIAPVKDYPDIFAAATAALEELPGAWSVQMACIAIAAPVQGDHIQVSNGSWAFSRASLQQFFGWSELVVINDFQAAAYGAVRLSPAQYLAIGRCGTPNSQLSSAIMGPGTGLGIAGLFPNGDGGWSAVSTEGGHARFAPGNGEEMALLEILHEELGGVQCEDFLSGRGLCNIYRSLAKLRAIDVPVLSDPALITAKALADNHSYCADVLNRFCAMLGTVAADVALHLGTRGRLFLAGGILPRVAEFLATSSFRQRFEDHPHFSHYLRAIETVLVTEKKLGLIGAAYCLHQQLHPPVHSPSE